MCNSADQGSYLSSHVAGSVAQSTRARSQKAMIRQKFWLKRVQFKVIALKWIDGECMIHITEQLHFLGLRVVGSKSIIDYLRGS